MTTDKKTWYIWTKVKGSNSANWQAGDPVTFSGNASERDAYLSRQRNADDTKTYAATETNAPPNN